MVKEDGELPTKFQPSPLIRLSVTPNQRMGWDEAAAAKAKKIGTEGRGDYRGNDQMGLKFCRELLHDTRHLPAKFWFPPLLRLPAPFLGKRPRVKTAGAKAIEADGSRGPGRKRLVKGRKGLESL